MLPVKLSYRYAPKLDDSISTIPIRISIKRIHAALSYPSRYSRTIPTTVQARAGMRENKPITISRKLIR